jgi:hypothetical protein
VTMKMNGKKMTISLREFYYLDFPPLGLGSGFSLGARVACAHPNSIVSSRARISVERHPGQPKNLRGGQETRLYYLNPEHAPVFQRNMKIIRSYSLGDDCLFSASLKHAQVEEELYPRKLTHKTRTI